jgi:hypothetical protein
MATAVIINPSSASDRIGAADFLLQLDDPVDQRFRSWRAAWHIDIDGNDSIAATHHCTLIAKADRI